MTSAVHDRPMHGPLEKIAIAQWAATVTAAWENRTLIRVGDSLVRVAVMDGEYHWHRHLGQDEFFLVLDGAIRIEVDGGTSVNLGPQDAYCVPAGMAHRPVAPTRSTVLMLERVGIVPAGD